MRKALAVSLSLALSLLAPGLRGYAHAARIVAVPAAGKLAPSAAAAGAIPTGTVGIAGSAIKVRLSVPLAGIGSLPTLRPSPSGVVDSAVPAALLLPVSQALQTAPAPDLLKNQREAGRSRIYSKHGSRDEVSGIGAAAAKPSSRRVGSLIKALSLPSLFKPGSHSSPESSKLTAEADFRLHAGGKTTRSRGESVEANGRGLVSGVPAVQAAFSAALAKLPVLSPGKGIPHGTFNIRNPNGLAAVFKVHSVSKAIEVQGRAVRTAKAASSLEILESSIKPSTRKNAAAPSAASLGNTNVGRAFQDSGTSLLNTFTANSITPREGAERNFGKASYKTEIVDAKHAQKKAGLSKLRIQYSSVYFPIAVLALSAALAFAAFGLPLFAGAVAELILPAAAVQSVGSSSVLAVLSGAFKAAFYAAGAIGLAALALTVWESFAFIYGVAIRGEVSDEEFWRFAHKEINSWDLHPSVRASLLGTGPGRGMLKIYRPGPQSQRLTFGFTAGGAVYLRPELIRTPWMFRMVLRHEFVHLRASLTRGPPVRRAGLGAMFEFLSTEFSARFRSLGGMKALAALRIPVLSRVLHEARISLRIDKPYDILMLNPGTHEVRNPSIYKDLSAGKANIVQAPRQASLRDFLDREENARRFRLAVYPQAFDSLPEKTSSGARKLRRALVRLDQIYILSRQLPYLHRSGLFEGSPEVARIRALTRSLGVHWHPGMSLESLEKIIDDLFYRTSRKLLAGIGFIGDLESFYRSIHHKGALILPFAPGEPGLDVVERLMRYWQAEDGGGFLVQRVDLPEGGHVIVARKDEPRIDLWLRPGEGRSLGESRTNVNGRWTHPEAQEEVLRAAGFNDEDIARFRDADLEIRHVFGEDVGENSIYVNVRKDRAGTLRRYADRAGIRFESSKKGYRLHLIETIGIHGVKNTWKLSIRGEGGRIYDIDTGLDVSHPDFSDRIMESIDFVDEDPYDWIGHGSHKAGISYANGTIYQGIAPAALGRMGKVFAQSGFGASDGDIMAAAVDAMEWGADVISLSLGSPGTVDAPLADFFSRLTRKKNSKGEKPIVTGSAGNSGPFSNSKSQPSVGKFVASVAAAAKSLDDNDPEIAFFSSAGPTLDKRFSKKRLRRPLGATAIGGDVTTPSDLLRRPPEKRDVYEHGVESVKSKDMPPGPSDTPDGKHTRMSGTSMSNPAYAGIALLVKQGILRVIKAGSAAHEFFMEELPNAVNLVIMRSAEDMGVPIFYQEAGFVDPTAAVLSGAETFGGELLTTPQRLRRFLFGWLGWRRAPAVAGASWNWISRVKRVWELEDRVFDESEAAKKKAIEDFQPEPVVNIDAPSENPHDRRIAKQALGNEAGKALEAAFKSARAEVLPELLAALKDKEWIVRMYAAFALLNLKAPEAVLPLAEAALGDVDGRVRQTASLALAETQSTAADPALRQALGSEKADVRIYAAFALARHGDASGVARIIAAAKSPDKDIRYTAVWLLGQLGRRAPPEAADALSSRVRDSKERGNINHLAVASLTEMALAKPGSVTDESVVSLLRASGPQNFALTRTISKFFRAAARSTEIRVRMRADPLKDDIVKFIHRHKAAVHRPGALGEMVRRLARIVNVSLDTPTPLPNPTGAGVPGVDPNLGPVHLIVEVPPAAEGGPAIESFRDFRGKEGHGSRSKALSGYGVDPELVDRHQAKLQTAMPVSQSLWFSVPDADVTAFQVDMEARGYIVRRAAPMYRLLHETGEKTGAVRVRKRTELSGRGVLVGYVDEGGDTSHPALPKERIRDQRNFAGDGWPDSVEKEAVSHGTHGMGIVGGQAVPGDKEGELSPYVGMAPGVEFAIAKVLSATGGSEATIMAGMEWAASLVKDPLKQPVLLNLSLGGPGTPRSPVARLANALKLKNIGVIVAAGNSGPLEGTVSTPANAALVTSIGAVDKNDKLTDYSSRGRQGSRQVRRVNIGGAVFFDRPNLYDIVSALNTRLAKAFEDVPSAVKWAGKTLYHALSGTSMAAPHETGEQALLIERMSQVFTDGLPDGYLFWLDELLDRTAKKLPAYGEHEVGAGRTDLEAALAALNKALQNPVRIRAEAEELITAAREEYGDPVEAPVPTPGRFHHLPLSALPNTISSVVLAGLLSLFP